MDDPIVIELLGKPMTKLRPRFARCGKGVRTYDSQSEEKTTIKWILKSKMKGKSPLEGALSVDMEFFFKKPKSSKRKYHTVKPDVDNIVKAILDNGNGIIWKDDNQIIMISAYKTYSSEEKTVIRIKEVGEL